MNKECQKTTRGQVWYIKEEGTDTRVKFNGEDNHIQAKGRPWLIVSGDKNNLNAPIVNCLPLSTKPDNYPFHAYFTYDGRPQVVLCEQIKTFNLSDLTRYEYTVTDDVMRRVDTAMCVQFGLEQKLPSMDALLATIEKIVLSKAQQMKDAQIVNDDAVQHIAAKLESLLTPKQAASSINKPQAAAPQEPIATKQKQPKRAGARPRYTDEQVKEFLADYDKLSLDEMLRKYNMADKGQLYKTKYYFINVRGKGNGAR